MFRVPNFWKDLGKKLSFGLVAAGGDTACKLAAWQSVYGGTWSPQEASDSNSFKYFICATIAFAPTCFLTVPFDNASRAYYADKTWPLEFRRNYRSPIQALLRIPFEEGPTYLLKGGFPIASSQFAYWAVTCQFYAWLKNKFFLLYLYNDISYDLCKFVWLSMSHFVGSIIAYPCYYTREMVDLWPKERGGHCTWNNNYRQCFKWMVTNMDMQYYNYLKGISQW